MHLNPHTVVDKITANALKLELVEFKYLAEHKLCILSLILVCKSQEIDAFSDRIWSGCDLDLWPQSLIRQSLPVAVVMTTTSSITNWPAGQDRWPRSSSLRGQQSAAQSSDNESSGGVAPAPDLHRRCSDLGRHTLVTTSQTSSSTISK